MTPTRLIPSNAGDVDDSRDMVLIGGYSPHALDLFSKAYTDRLALNEDSVCARYLRDQQELEDPALRDVRCGYLRYNTIFSLLMSVQVAGGERDLPIGTRLGALAQRHMLGNCFPAPDGPLDNRPRTEPYLSDGQISASIRINSMGEGLTAPALYDPHDCRMLGLPLLQGGDVRW